MTPGRRKEGWFSATAKSFSGHAVYRRPDGTEVEVTHVYDLGQGQNTTFKDIVSVGEVTDCVSSHDKFGPEKGILSR